ncbi:MAG TPA: helix-turn-helix domain-containing protein, partial [Anaerolineales bacterium]|nr:helix-turn-helix domain-containing protein [Anaerolineales bacterium]
MADVSFGEWLKRRRKAGGWTQEQLALQINCSTSALRKLEAELRRPSREIIQRLAEIFHIPLEEQKSFQRFARGDWMAYPGGDVEEAPWRVARAVHRTHLPASTTSFIGREKEQKEIIDLIVKHRLVTLTGAGGIGKTRLALETAQQALTTFPDGLWFIEFAPLSDLELVPQVVVTTLGLIEQANRPPLTILTDFLRARRALLILDN